MKKVYYMLWIYPKNQRTSAQAVPFGSLIEAVSAQRTFERVRGPCRFELKAIIIERSQNKELGK